MTEQPPGPTEENAEDPAEDPADTGYGPLDDLVRSLDGLGELPVDQHVAMFENAHTVLRAMLKSE
ncbi:MAG: hypothetical protein ACRCYQ_14585 [Nocardioides sp.]